MSKDIAYYASQGYCCSQIMVALGLNALGDQNPQLLDAVRGLCKGFFTGGVCGTLTGAACLLSMLDPRAAEEHLIPRLAEWFAMTFGEAYGGQDCRSILDDNPMNKFERCPAIMAQTAEKCRELLSETGFEL